ncbi:hypothetical protein NUW58_g7189 [Xylaria curta]|uniref:Uncharacterized protein n=1 Tax=Xylaria curta TaxID=42375 RepID=A0ACC1NKU0_9PEZI|nr:hypothetical protein NUW58_g7189 [Xylaria curta]
MTYKVFVRMKAVYLLILQAGLARAGLRFACSSISFQRLDPVVEPGQIPSAHVHQIVGGNAFNATMQGDIGEKGTCTTCAYTEDFSNYWTAAMVSLLTSILFPGIASKLPKQMYLPLGAHPGYFRHENGSYKRVPQYPNAQLGYEGQDAPDIKGGMTIYYTPKDFNGNGDQPITAFKPVRSIYAF